METAVAPNAAESSVQTVAEAVRHATDTLAQAGIDTARLDAQVLLGHVLGSGRETVFSSPEKVLADAESAQFAALVASRADRQPISQIVGYKEFWGRPFAVTQDILTPRPESETVISAVLDRLEENKLQHQLNFLDLGTGTGCLLLTLLAECPMARGIGVDISQAAITVARENARSLKLEHRVGFIERDWSAGLLEGSKFDVVVSNPPYISDQEWPELEAEVTHFEPATALKGGVDGLDAYRILVPQIRRLLAAKGFAAIEIGAGQAADVACILETAGLKVQEICPDLAGIDRVLVAR